MASVLNGGRYLAVYTMSLSPTPTIGMNPVLTLDAQIKTDVGYSLNSSHEITVEHIRDDSGLYSFLESYTDTTTGSDTEEITYEDGTKTSAATTQFPLLLIVKGGMSGSARKIYTAVVRVDPTSGAWSQEGNKYNRPALKFASIDPGAPVTVPSTYYTGIAVTPAQVVFGTGAAKYGKVTFA